MNAIEKPLLTFVDLLTGQTDEVLEKPWAWGSYESEGVRFGVLRVIEELESLWAGLATREGLPESLFILSGACEAYRDLQAALHGLDPEVETTAPGEGEWDVRTTYAHIVGAELGFYGVTAYSLELHRAGNWSEDAKMSDEVWDRVLDIDEASYEALLAGSLQELRAAHAGWHEKIAALFGGITDEELSLPSRYWEEETLTLRFRLGRFASHMRQHTIQIDKTLAALGRDRGEIEMLVRRVLQAYGRGEPFFGADSGERVIALVEELSGVISSL